MYESDKPVVNVNDLLDRKLILQSQLFNPGRYSDYCLLKEAVNQIRKIDNTLQQFNFKVVDVNDEPI